MTDRQKAVEVLARALAGEYCGDDDLEGMLPVDQDAFRRRATALIDQIAPMLAPPLDADVAGLVGWLLAWAKPGMPYTIALKESAAMLKAQAAELARLRAALGQQAEALESCDAVIARHGLQNTAAAMLLHIDETLRAKGKAVLTTEGGDFGSQVVTFAAAIRARPAP